MGTGGLTDSLRTNKPRVTTTLVTSWYVAKYVNGKYAEDNATNVDNFRSYAIFPLQFWELCLLQILNLSEMCVKHPILSEHASYY